MLRNLHFCASKQTPDFLIEFLTQNVIFHVKSHVPKHEFWGLLILKSQHLMLPNLTWNETWNDTSLKKLGDRYATFVEKMSFLCSGEVTVFVRFYTSRLS